MKNVLSYSKAVFLVVIVFCLIIGLTNGCSNKVEEDEIVINSPEPSVSSQETNPQTTENYNTTTSNSALSEQTRGENVYTVSNYSQNPKTPEEVLVAYWFLIDEHIKDKASLEDVLKIVPGYQKEEAERTLLGMKKKGPLNITEVEIIEVAIKNTEIKITYFLTFENRKNRTKGEAILVREDEKWKVSGTILY